jgi:hypothetical protein
MPKITDDNLVTVYLKARDIYEAGLVAAYTSPRDIMHEDRMSRVHEAVSALLATLEIEEKVDG